MAKTVVVTGGCGYIGSHTILELIEHTDFNIISIDNYLNSTADTLDRIEEISGRRIHNYEVDLCDYEKLAKTLKELNDVIGVIHFAALKSVPDSVADPVFYYHNNINSLLNVLKACDEFKINNHIFSSSCSVYGNVASLPVNEETVLQKSESPYAYSKKVGEEMIRNFSAVSKVNTIALRYFNPVGAHESGLNGESPINPPTNLVPIITRTAAGIIPQMTVFGEEYDTRDGTCVRDYVHVSDIASAHVIALNYLIEGKNETNFDILNLGTGNGVTVVEAIQAFEKVSGVALNYHIGPRREGDVGAIYSDCTKVKNVLGWEAKRDITNMMETAWKWQQQLMSEA